MPRVSKPLYVSPEDLEALKSNLAHADRELAERIRIVMACSSENSNRTVAEQLQVNEHTVAKWKKAYQDKGLKGLLSSHGGGRKAKYDATNLEQAVSLLISPSGENANTVRTLKALADETGASEYQISLILKKLNISLSRNHAWNYQTSKTGSYPGSAEITGIYLTGRQCAIVAAYHNNGIITSSGEFYTGNRNLALKPEQSEDCLSCNDVMTECVFYRNDRDETETLEGFIKRLVNEALSCPASDTDTNAEEDAAGRESPITIGVFVFSGEPFTSHQIWPSNVDYCSYSDRKEWLTRMHSWFGARSSGAALMALEDTMETISRYLDRSSECGCTPFIWSSHIIRTGSERAFEQTAEIPEISSAAETAESVSDKASADSGSDSDNGRRSLLSLYENIDKNDAVQSGFIFFAKGKDGIEFGSVVNDSPMPESDFGFNSEEEFLKGMNKLEQQMLSMRDKAGIAATGLYISQVKKKEKVTGLLRQYVAESEPGRFPFRFSVHAEK